MSFSSYSVSEETSGANYLSRDTGLESTFLMGRSGMSIACAD